MRAAAWWAVVVLLLCMGGTVNAQKTRLLNLKLDGGYVETEVGYEQQSSKSAQSLYYDRDRLDFRPRLHLDLSGSVYHPNLIDVMLSADLGASIEYEQFSQSGGAVQDDSRANQNPLQYYNWNTAILKEKKVSGTVFGSRSLVRLDNDFATRRLFDQTTYGGRLNYRGSVLPWILTLRHQESEERGFAFPSSRQEDEIKFDMKNERAGWGGTDFNYTHQDFERFEFNLVPFTGTRRTARLYDVSSFMAGRYSLSSGLTYNDIDTSRPSSSLQLNERLRIEHTPHLKSSYQYSYAERSSVSTESEEHSGSASLTHQLYASLTSRIDGEMQSTDSTSQNSLHYGGGISESYTKRIGELSRLALGASYRVNKERREANQDSGRIVDELHILQTDVITLLNEPNVDQATVIVTDSSGIPYFNFIDYELIPRGSLIEIKRVETGDIPDGGSVLVSYDSLSSRDGNSRTTQDSYRFRYSFLNNFFSVYGHMRRTENSTDNDLLILEDVEESVLGAEGTWNRLSVGAEYQKYDSSLVPYKNIRFYQRLNVNLGLRSSLNFSAGQNYVTYQDNDEEVTRYTHRISYNTQLSSQTVFQLSGRHHKETRSGGEGEKRNLLVGEAELNYRIAKTLLTLSGEFRDERHQGQDRENIIAYLRWRRLF